MTDASEENENGKAEKNWIQQDNLVKNCGLIVNPSKMPTERFWERDVTPKNGSFGNPCTN